MGKTYLVHISYIFELYVDDAGEDDSKVFLILDTPLVSKGLPHLVISKSPRNAFDYQYL